MSNSRHYFAQQWLETLNIPVDGSTVTSTITLDDGVEYQLTARGSAWIDQTYYPGPEIYGYTGDAEYATGNDTVGSGQAEDALFGTDVGINVSGAQETNIHWGQYNPAGIYTINLTGTGQPITLHYRLPSQADPYPDPSAYNTLAVDISRITPIVSVTATDPEASEDNQDPAVFTFTRTGSTARDLTVYYTLDGTATPGTLDTEGNPDPEHADYTGPVADSEHEGLYKITLSAGRTSKTLECIPLNDALDESDESIIVSIVDAPEDAPSNGLNAPPTTQPGNAAVNKNLNVSSVSGTDWGDKDANKPTDAQLDEQVGKLADANTRQGAITTLKNMIKDYPSIEPYLDQKITGENNPDVVGALYDILASKFAATVTQDSTNPNQLNVTFRKPPGIVGVAKWSVTIRPENPGLLKMNAQQGAGEVVIAGPDSISIDLSLNNLATPPIAVTTLDKGQTTLVVGWVALKQKPDQTFEPVEESRGTRWYQIKLGNAGGN